MSQLVPFLNYGLEDYNVNDDTDFFLSVDPQQDKKMFMTLEALNAVPTLTTSTVTPTNSQHIEQTFIEVQKTESHENEAHFVPPLVHTIDPHYDFYNSKSQNQWQSNLSQSSLSDCDTRSTPPLTLSTGFPNNTQPTRRNMGGRKPTKDINMSPEDEERRRIRRERNKAAAARCRKRRVDHTNALIRETEELERTKSLLQDSIQSLKEKKDELEYVLEHHERAGKCRRRSNTPPDIKPFEMYQPPQCQERVKTEMIEPLNTPTTNDLFILPSPKRQPMLAPISKPSRPSTLNVGFTAPQSISDLAGIPISTPSSGLTFNFESLMGGGTGLTPVSNPLVPSCSTQQRNVPTSSTDLSSPDACNPPKLVSL
ncbi:transcription factor kayak isoform X2 [Aethina tumida]|uniref:transcription factor kayak isoform X2 n=1 Tax=Aethina tumida TaxID=116153 RepID=UPI00096B195C|nr:transcription factor kayak isoform X2 [Aethina tumida]